MAPTRPLTTLFVLGLARCLASGQPSSHLRSTPVSGSWSEAAERLETASPVLGRAAPVTRRPRRARRSLAAEAPCDRIPLEDPASVAGFLMANSESATTAPTGPEEEKAHRAASFFDAFWLTYWGTVAILSVVGFVCCYCAAPAESDAVDTPVSKLNSLLTESVHADRSRADGGVSRVELSEDMWALVLVAALGRAKMKSGRSLSVWPVALASIFMGSIQIMSLFLIIHDMDPNAEPVTTRPSSPYGTVGSVNAMKIVMTIIMMVALVSEFARSLQILDVTLRVGELDGTPKCVPLFFAAWQYLVAIFVVWSGVSVILSFQSAPNIVYSSMSIMLISNVDEMFFAASKAILAFNAQFDNIEVDTEDCDMSLCYRYVCKLLLVFPVLLGVQLFLRAWYTGIMPTARLRILIQAVSAVVLGEYARQ